MNRKTVLKIFAVSLSAMMIVTLTSCGGAKVPDEYNYDLSKYVKLGKRLFRFQMQMCRVR